MTDQRMMEMLEEARQHSIETGKPIYAMGNGEHIVYTASYDMVTTLKELGYWVVSLFVNGNRAEI